MTEGGNVFAWLHEILDLPPGTDLDSLLTTMEPEAHGLTVLPFLAGERSPGWAGDARATLHGLTQATTPVDIVRAGMEAVAYRVALVFDRLKPLLPSGFEVIASGGALLNSPVWLQMMADVLGRPVTTSKVEEASARGAALLALEALGALDDDDGGLAGVPRFTGRSVVPDEGRRAVYRKAMERQAVCDRQRFTTV